MKLLYDLRWMDPTTQKSQVKNEIYVTPDLRLSRMVVSRVIWTGESVFQPMLWFFHLYSGEKSQRNKPKQKKNKTEDRKKSNMKKK